jgi:RNA-binding protein
MPLTGKQKRYLRSLGHRLRPVVFLGKGGLGRGVVRQTDDALEAHELIKVRFADGFDRTPDEGAAALALATGATVAGRVGRTALLYRRREEEPEIELPPPAGGDSQGT